MGAMNSHETVATAPPAAQAARAPLDEPADPGDAGALAALAERALAALRRAGFDQAQAAVSLEDLTELNVELNRAALLRSGQTLRVGLVGITDARRASTELSDGSDEALAEAVQRLHAAALASPQDAAHAVSAGQQSRLVQGPLEADTPRLAASAAELLAFREQHTPRTVLKSAEVLHRRRRSVLFTTGGSDLRADLGHYELHAVFNAREGSRSSSFNFAGGSTHDLAAQPAPAWFGIGELMREVAQAIDARPLAALPGGAGGAGGAGGGAAFDGELVLTPAATESLLEWLLGQLGDERLLSGTSLFRDRVGQPVASPLLTLANRPDAPGVCALSPDGFVAPPLTLLAQGRLQALTPSLYASRKTGLPHRPLASGGGWALAAGSQPWRELVAAVPRGALVARLSMGRPAANGDFAGVVKNSFLIEGGRIGAPLAETMVSGNVARMLHEVLAVSAERIDTGGWCLPWLRVGGMRFS